MNVQSVLFAVVFLVISFSSSAITTKGNISILRAPSYELNSIYFKLDVMPQGVTQWFYAMSVIGDQAGCSRKGNNETLNRTYAMLLAAKSSHQKVTVDYCLDSNGYGVVNFVQLEP